MHFLYSCCFAFLQKRVQGSICQLQFPGLAVPLPLFPPQPAFSVSLTGVLGNTELTAVPSSNIKVTVTQPFEQLFINMKCSVVFTPIRSVQESSTHILVGTFLHVNIPPHAEGKRKKYSSFFAIIFIRPFFSMGTGVSPSSRAICHCSAF